MSRAAPPPDRNEPSAADDVAESRIVEAWLGVADPWTRAVREQRIDSRRLVTDRAIVEVVGELAPRRVLDIGCGEGWLARAMAETGIEATGVDVSPELIERAREAGGGRFEVRSYDALADDVEWREHFDVCACNFSLLGKQSVEHLLAAIPRMLVAGGALVVQTLHPHVACGDHEYHDGWRDGTWAGINGAFGAPAPWYFRTMESWVNMYIDCGFCHIDVREPLHPLTGAPASLIVIGHAD
ncbi:MAG: methyltransferase domain-containing protein [Dokdonella sp.]